MPIDEGINTDIRFLILEVKKQARASFSAIEKPTQKKLEKIRIREDYVDNLKNTLENKSYFNIHRQEERQMNYFKAVITIAANLERCADFFENIAEQMEHVVDPQRFRKFDLRRYYSVIYRAIDAIYPALTEHNLDLAQKICDYEEVLDEYYAASFQAIRKSLQQRRHVDDMLALLTIVGYLERAGDSFLNIGEAILDIHVGEKMGIVTFKDLRKGLDAQGIDISSDKVDFTPIMNTRSGCRVAKITVASASKKVPTAVFYKEGSKEKIKAEIVGLRFWEEKFPGMTPKILWNNTRKGHTTLLLEYLEGDDLMALLLKERGKPATALKLLARHSNRIWTKSKREKATRSDYIGQLNRRKGDIESVHDSLFESGQLEGAKKIERGIRIPFSTIIHGDFNADNIIFQRDGAKMYYVDVHRSGYGDYVQDVSVFLVSNIRLPIFSRDVRARLNAANQAMYECGAKFAKKHKDTTYEARLALGLFRSLLTSTRFIFDKSFSAELFDRAVSILESLLEERDNLQDFKLKKEFFLYE